MTPSLSSKNENCKEQNDVKVEMIRAAFDLVDKN